jgi:hypothetical protein
MFNELAPRLPWLLAARSRRIVLIAFIVLVWSMTWAANNMGAHSSAVENWMTKVAIFRNPMNRAGGAPQSIAGPHPYIDVTAYGCKGDAATNDAACIRAAIRAACEFTVGEQLVHPIVVFPAGHYVVTQPQKPSRSPVFEIPCSNLTIRGMGTSSVPQFTRAPSVLIQSIPGPAPNNAPVFDVRFPGAVSGFTLQDLTVEGYNKALWVYDTTGAKLDNVTLSVQNTSLADNSALILTNVLWFEWNGGECVNAEIANKYCILMTGDAPIRGETPLVGLVRFDNMQGIGGMVRYDQRVNTVGSGPGSWVFENIRAWEANQGPFLSITNSTGNPDSAAIPAVGNITMSNVSSSDSGGQFPLIQFGPASLLSGVIIDMSLAGLGGSPAIVMNPSAVIFGCNIRASGNTGFTAWDVIDTSGNPFPGCSITNLQGFDFITTNTGGNSLNLRSDIFPQNAPQGPAVRLTLAPNRFAGVALDPTYGLMLNTGNAFGFGAGIGETVAGSIDVEFPKNYPPTSLVGAPTTGGTIAAGTYYGTLYSSTSASTCNGTESAPSIQSAAVKLSGPNNAINWSWTLPIAGAVPVLGYCVSVSTSPNLKSGAWQPAQSNWQFISEASTASLAMKVLPTSGGPNVLISALTPAHRFTPNSFGIDTTSPVPHTLTQNGGYVCPIATKSSAYTLVTGDCRIQVTGTTTITIPHTLPATGLTNIWHVFSVSGTTALACDSGTINGSATITIANNTGKDAYADGTNCFAQ